MDFAGITEIKIPQGNVEKITETSSGRVLWEKVSKAFGYFIHAKPFSPSPVNISDVLTMGSSTSNLNEFTSYEASYVKTSGWYASGRGHDPVRNIQALGSFPICSYLKKSKVGNKYPTVYATKSEATSKATFTAYYEPNSALYSGINDISEAQKLTDAKWGLSPFYLGVAQKSQYLNDMYDFTFTVKKEWFVNGDGTISSPKKVSPIILPKAQIPVTFSGTSGASISITGFKDLASHCQTLYNNNYTTSSYATVEYAPYFWGWFFL